MMDTASCAQCGRVWPIDKLDAKPGPGRFTVAALIEAADAGKNFDRLEGPCCYGPGYVDATPKQRNKP